MRLRKDKAKNKIFVFTNEKQHCIINAPDEFARCISSFMTIEDSRSVDSIVHDNRFAGEACNLLFMTYRKFAKRSFYRFTGNTQYFLYLTILIFYSCNFTNFPRKRETEKRRKAQKKAGLIENRTGGIYERKKQNRCHAACLCFGGFFCAPFLWGNILRKRGNRRLAGRCSKYKNGTGGGSSGNRYGRWSKERGNKRFIPDNGSKRRNGNCDRRKQKSR